MIIADYECLFELRDQIKPDCWVIFHSYDFPPANVMGKGILWLGPWLQPGLIKQGWTNPADQSAIVKLLLQELHNRYSAFAATQNKCLYVKTQGYLQNDDWGNELHLTSVGWNKIAQVVNAEMIKAGIIKTT